MSLESLVRDSLKGKPIGLGGQPPIPTQESAITSLTKYIPTETVTLYLFGLSVIPKPDLDGGMYVNHMVLYFSLLTFTPICFWLIFAAKFRSLSAQLFWPKFNDIPVWRLVASVLGFGVWALAIPNNGLTSEGSHKIFALIALFLSVVFGLLEQVLEPKSS